MSKNPDQKKEEDRLNNNNIQANLQSDDNTREKSNTELVPLKKLNLKEIESMKLTWEMLEDEIPF